MSSGSISCVQLPCACMWVTCVVGKQSSIGTQILAATAAECKVFVGYAVLMLLFACSCSGAAKLVALQRGLSAQVQDGRSEEHSKGEAETRQTPHPRSILRKRAARCRDLPLGLGKAHLHPGRFQPGVGCLWPGLKLAGSWFGGARLLPATPAAGLGGITSHCAAGDLCALQLI